MQLAALGVAAILAATAPGAAHAQGPRATAGHQQDPKAKEITAQLVRSTDNATVTLRTTFPDETPGVKVSLYNLLGKLVEVHPTTVAQKGSNEFQFRTRGLPNGPYIVVLEAAGQRIVNKVMLSR